MQDNFKDKAQNWDKGSPRVNGALTIANAIREKYSLNATMDIMDFGVGTGLLGFEVLKYVKSVFGVDTSKSMLLKLEQKNTADFHIESCNQDILKNPLNQTFDGIVSSMTLHHVENLELFFKTVYKNINKDGFIAIADLETEDGTFHSNNEGVFHFGFDKKSLCKILENTGYKNIQFKNINTINKPQRDYGVFLLTASV